MDVKFELYTGARDYRFCLRAANGEVIASGEGYNSRFGAINGIDSVKKYAANAPIEDRT